jgi:predicted nucleotidyltransferase component of viral defense system
MFHLFTVENSTYKVLKNIFTLDFIANNFALAGGTSLALQIGSRVSVDLDFFAPNKFDTDELDNYLSKELGSEYILTNMSKRMLFCYISGVKCDFVFEPAQPLEPFITFDGIRVYSVKDIAAMKLHTICGRGKKKDFFDIYSLLEIHRWGTMVEWFIEKYNSEQQFFLIRSIFYFEDANNDPEIISFDPYISDWQKIKQIIIDKVSQQ